MCPKHGTELVPATAEWCLGELFCPDCDTEQSFSDLYKDEVGVRPDLSAYSLAQMRGWLETRLR